jgi:hypothetical protein
LNGGDPFVHAALVAKSVVAAPLKRSGSDDRKVLGNKAGSGSRAQRWDQAESGRVD